MRVDVVPRTDTDHDPRLSLRDVAQRADVSYETAARWVRSGRLPALKVRIKGLRTEWRVSAQDLREFLEQ
ncbi:MAG: helix-turn-helix domain-containing protein [Phycisphaerales bacterium]|nr:helix-turn-helix domain-containing protein [Phycisphaerales bacterium]